MTVHVRWKFAHVTFELPRRCPRGDTGRAAQYASGRREPRPWGCNVLKLWGRPEGGGGGEEEGCFEAQVGSELSAHLSRGRMFRLPGQTPVFGHLLTFGGTWHPLAASAPCLASQVCYKYFLSYRN